MNLIHFIYFLGITFIVFNLLWKGMLILLWSVIKRPIGKGLPYLFLKFLDRYLLASIAVLITLVRIQDLETRLDSVLYGLIGGGALFFYLAGRMGNKTMQVSINNRVMRFGEPPDIRIETAWALFSVAVYWAGLLWPPLAHNAVAEGVLVAVETIYQWPIIGWIIAILGVIFSIRFIARGTLLIMRVFTGKGWRRKSKEAVADWERTHKNLFENEGDDTKLTS